MNLDMMYEATNYTGNQQYATIANHQAEKSSDSHVRPDGTTFHVVNMDQKTGQPMEFMTAQGESNPLLPPFFRLPLISQVTQTTRVGLEDKLGEFMDMLNVVSRDYTPSLIGLS